MKLHRIAFPVAALLLAGCALVPRDIPVRIYDITNGDVYTGVIAYSGLQGRMSTTMARGVTCSGDYFTEDNRTRGTSWGSIYAWGSNGFSGNANQVGVQSVQPGSMGGTAILACTDRNVVQCEYVVNRRSNQGAGFCRDNAAGRYRFVF